MQCPICQMKALIEVVAKGRVYGRDQWTYHACVSCEFIFLNPSERLSSDDEKARYLTHNNNHFDQGFSDFLDLFAEPVSEILKDKQLMKGLDFGSGPEAVLAEKFRQRGFEISIYDLFFAADESVFEKTYDFVICHEVIEHCFEPLREIKIMLDVLKTGGVLAIRTLLHPGPESFESWRYRKDPTHVSFFQKKTFEFIANKYNLRILKSDKDITVFEKI